MAMKWIDRLPPIEWDGTWRMPVPIGWSVLLGDGRSYVAHQSTYLEPGNVGQVIGNPFFEEETDAAA